MTLTRNRWTAALAGVWLLALALRLIYLFELHNTPFMSVLVVDGRQYDGWAQQIAGGQWLGTGVFFQTPLYPYLLGCLYAVAGHHVMLVRIFQAALGASSCVLLAMAGRRFFSPGAGLIAGLWLAVYPEAIFWDGQVQKSSLDGFLMTLLLAVFGMFLARPRRRWLVVAGIALGAFMLNRENARVLYPIVVVWLIAYFRDTPLRVRVGWVAVVTACVAAVALPVGARNYAVAGEFLISTSQLGPNLYIGNRAGAAGTYEPLVPGHGNPLDEREDATVLAERATGRNLPAGALSDYWAMRTIDEIRRAPLAWVRLLGRKCLLTINAGEIVDSESLQEYARFSMLLRATRWMNFGVLLPIAVLGAWVTRRAWRTLAILYATAAGMAMAIVLFYVLSRYRFPLAPIAILFAAAALANLPGIRVTWRDWLPGGFLAAVVAVASHLPLTSASNVTNDNVGAELIRVGRPADAVPVLEQAVRIAPGDARAHYDLGVAFERAGAPQMSLEEFTTAVRLQPAFADAHDALGSALRARGENVRALEQFAEAAGLRPDIARIHLNYGVALWEAGRHAEAMAEYREAVRISPDDSVAHNDLATALQQAGQIGEAIPHYEAALRLRPDYPEAHANFALALAAIGRTDDAIGQFQAALRLAPGSFGTHVNFGDLLLRVGRNGDAIHEYQEAARLAPDDVDTALAIAGKLAQAYVQAGRPDDAIAALTTALRLARAAGRVDAAGRIVDAIRAVRR